MDSEIIQAIIVIAVLFAIGSLVVSALVAVTQQVLGLGGYLQLQKLRKISDGQLSPGAPSTATVVLLETNALNTSASRGHLIADDADAKARAISTRSELDEVARAPWSALAKQRALPTDISPNLYASAVLETVVPAREADGRAPDVVALKEKAGAELQESSIGKFVQATVDEVGNDLVALRQAVARRYDDQMNRLKSLDRRFDFNLRIIWSIVIVVAFNINFYNIVANVEPPDPAIVAVERIRFFEDQGTWPELSDRQVEAISERADVPLRRGLIGLPIGWGVLERVVDEDRADIIVFLDERGVYKDNPLSTAWHVLGGYLLSVLLLLPATAFWTRFLPTIR